MSKCLVCNEELNNDNKYCNNCYSVIHYKKDTLNFTNETLPINQNDKKTLHCFITTCYNFLYFFDNIKNYKYKDMILVINNLDTYHYIDIDNIKLLNYKNAVRNNLIDIYIINNQTDKRYLELFFNSYDYVYFLGYPNSGKTTLFDYYAKKEHTYVDLAFSTRYIDKYVNKNYTLIDTISFSFDDFYKYFNYETYNKKVISNKTYKATFNLIIDTNLFIEKLLSIKLNSRPTSIDIISSKELLYHKSKKGYSEVVNNTNINALSINEKNIKTIKIDAINSVLVYFSSLCIIKVKPNTSLTLTYPNSLKVSYFEYV